MRRPKGALRVKWGSKTFYADIVGKADGCIILTYVDRSKPQIFLPLDRPVYVWAKGGELPIMAAPQSYTTPAPDREEGFISEDRQVEIEVFNRRKASEGLGNLWR